MRWLEVGDGWWGARYNDAPHPPPLYLKKLHKQHGPGPHMGSPCPVLLFGPSLHLQNNLKKSLLCPHMPLHVSRQFTDRGDKEWSDETHNCILAKGGGQEGLIANTQANRERQTRADSV